MLVALPALRGIKENPVNYPCMAVSKVLHFSNPSLFPIFDTDVMWEQVMWGRRRAGNAPLHPDWTSFCRSSGFNPEEMGSRFQHDYALWASRAVQCADTDLMEWFAEWMDSRYGDDIHRLGIKSLVRTLYATAFEFIAIGVSV